MSASDRDDQVRREPPMHDAPRAAAPPLPPPRDRDVALGFLTGVGLHVVIQGAAMWAASVLSPESELGLAWVVPALFWGVTQMAYMVPVYALLRRRDKLGHARGLAICGLVSFLLWGGCMGILMAEGQVL